MDKKYKANLSVPILVGKGESISQKITEVIDEIEKVPQLQVELLDISVQVNRMYKYVD